MALLDKNFRMNIVFRSWDSELIPEREVRCFVVDGKVLVGDEDGDFCVLASSKEKKVLSEVNLGAPIYGTPIVANGVIYLQSNSHLYTFHDAAKAAKDEVPKIELKP